MRVSLDEGSTKLPSSNQLSWPLPFLSAVPVFVRDALAEAEDAEIQTRYVSSSALVRLALAGGDILLFFVDVRCYAGANSAHNPAGGR